MCSFPLRIPQTAGECKIPHPKLSGSSPSSRVRFKFESEMVLDKRWPFLTPAIWSLDRCVFYNLETNFLWRPAKMNNYLIIQLVKGTSTSHDIHNDIRFYFCMLRACHWKSFWFQNVFKEEVLGKVSKSRKSSGVIKRNLAVKLRNRKSC